MRTKAALAALVLLAVFLAIYLPDLGHGFIKDDFRWIRDSSLVDGRQVTDLFRTNIGFYRPVVAMTFAADFASWGLRPFGYGLTNLVICLADAALLFIFARRMNVTAAAALLAAGVWALNFHGINVALLWISGRTSLLVVLFTLLTALAMTERRTMLAGLAALLAMLSKEDGVMLPVLWSVVTLVESSGTIATRAREVARRTWALWAALAVYGPLRLNSGAFWPADAPDYYRFTFDAPLVWRNLLEYTDRAGTLALVVSVILLSLSGFRPHLDADHRRALRLVAVWIPASLVLTIFLPLRSSLYALMPAIGTAIGAGVVADAVSRRAPVRFHRAAWALIVVAVVSIPIHRSRNERTIESAELTERTLDLLRHSDIANATPRTVALIDNSLTVPTFEASFGTMASEAIALALGSQWTGDVWPSAEATPADATVRVMLRSGGELDIASR